MFARAALLLGLVLSGPAQAGDAEENFRWLSGNDTVLREGLFWNDWLGDGRDRYKTGGLTQSWLIPEMRLGDGRWLEGRASLLELQVRALVITPANTVAPAPGDRPFAQYAAAGLYLRSAAAPAGGAFDLLVEDRAGLEIGLVGEPLPLFALQDALHDASGMAASGRTASNTLGTGILANLDARRTWRLHLDLGGADLQAAPFANLSAGFRVTGARAGLDLITGSDLARRTWNHDPATGALIPGGSAPRPGWHWTAWAGGDVGYTAHDAFLDGGALGDGPSVPRRPVTARLRAGVMTEFRGVALSYSVNWLSPEFDAQPGGQVIGAIQLKVPF